MANIFNIKAVRLATYWRVMRGLEKYPLGARQRIAAAVCRELWRA